MRDNEYSELKLRALIAPAQSTWPRPDVDVSTSGDRVSGLGMQWQNLHKAADAARNHVAAVWAEADAIDADRDLSPEGKARRKQKLAADALATLENDTTLGKARDTVARLHALYAEQAGAAIKAPTTLHDVLVAGAIRRHVASLKGNKKLDFVNQHGSDPRVLSALLTAPPFLAGLNDDDMEFVQRKADEHLPDKLVKDREATAKALSEVETGFERAAKAIAEKGGLAKASDGAWPQASTSEAA